MCTPKGSAFLYARRETQSWVEPLIVSWGYESEYPSASRFIDEQEWNGTRDIAAYLAVSDAIRFYQEHNWDRIVLRCHALAQVARKEICRLTRLAPICPDSTDWYMQMFSARLPPCDPNVLKARLYDEFRIEVPIVIWRGDPYIRVSIQAYNMVEDVERLVEALRKIIREHLHLRQVQVSRESRE